MTILSSVVAHVSVTIDASTWAGKRSSASLIHYVDSEYQTALKPSSPLRIGNCLWRRPLVYALQDRFFDRPDQLSPDSLFETIENLGEVQHGPQNYAVCAVCRFMIGALE